MAIGLPEFQREHDNICRIILLGRVPRYILGNDSWFLDLVRLNACGPGIVSSLGGLGTT